MKARNVLPAIFLYSLLALLVFPAEAQPLAVLKGDSLYLEIGKDRIFSGRLSGSGSYQLLQQSREIRGARTVIITINGREGNSFSLQGSVAAEPQSIACESDPRDAGLKWVRQTSGPSHSLLNNAVYNRQADWLLSWDVANARVRVNPAAANNFDLQAQGSEMVIRFRPDYFRLHRGLDRFQPRQYEVWKDPVVGWCSWFAYFDKITEGDIRSTADVLGSRLRPYGLEYLQIDDGYQQVPIGLPSSWLEPNKKFPAGLKKLAEYISARGLVPGIWTNVSFADSAAAFAHRDLFVKDTNGQPAVGNWVGYMMDGSNPRAVRDLVSPVYQGLMQAGWKYYKLDALRHLKYEGYNSHADYFSKKGKDRNEAFREVVAAVRRQVGRDHFLMACWGIRPELVGLVDGCRIGNDGYSYAGLAQFNSYNNIVWRNDPDHIVLSPAEAFRSCSATSLTGSLFMLTDRPEKYSDTFILAAARRSIPVLFTQPGQLYDVDPSRSDRIAMADAEMSGSGPRPFDASTTTTTGLFGLEVNRAFENWLVLGRLDERDSLLPFRDLGLQTGIPYLVYEFWTGQLQGVFTDQFRPGPIDPRYHCQVFCFRPLQDHPQLLATNRHLSCGGLEISTMAWEGSILSGTSELVAGDSYEIYFYEPGNYIYQYLDCAGAQILENNRQGAVRTVRLKSLTGGKVTWKLHYQLISDTRNQTSSE